MPPVSYRRQYNRNNNFASRFCTDLLLIFNVIILIVSVCSLSIAIWIIAQRKPLEQIVGSNYYSSAAYIIIAVCITSFPVLGLGCFAAKLQFKYLLLVYFLCLLALVCLSLIAGTLGFILRTQVDSSLKTSMLKSMLQFYGTEKEQKLTESWDFMQKEFQCCGVMTDGEGNHTVWSESFWFQKRPLYPKPWVPKSCCPTCQQVHDRYCVASAGNEEKELICNAYSRMCSSSSEEYANLRLCQNNGADAPVNWPVQAYRNTEGCYPRLKSTMRKTAALIGIVSIALVCVFLIAMASSCALHRLSF